MTQEQWTGAIVLGSIATVFGALMFGIWHERRRQRHDPKIEELIKAAKPVHQGFDPAVRERSAKKRERAERVKARANAIVSSAAPAPKRKPAADNVRQLKRRA